MKGKQPGRSPLHGYVMIHTPSGRWHPGHSTLKVYYSEHDAREDYAKYQGWDGATWVPVKVVVQEVR